jgi:hypothetical protein
MDRIRQHCLIAAAIFVLKWAIKPSKKDYFPNFYHYKILNLSILQKVCFEMPLKDLQNHSYEEKVSI